MENGKTFFIVEVLLMVGQIMISMQALSCKTENSINIDGTVKRIINDGKNLNSARNSEI